MRNKRVLITGGAGLVGSSIAEEAARMGAREIIVLDNFIRGRRENLASAMANGRVTMIEGDIMDRSLLKEAFQGIDVVFHQAAIRITQCAEDPRLAFEVLAEGTFNVLQAAVEAKVRKVVAASSASVYGMADHFPTTEYEGPYGNRTFYGAAKTFNEGMLRSFNEMYGLRYIALRYFNVYGPRMDMYGVYTEVLIRWMERIACGQSPLILGNGRQTMDFIYIEDVARANILAAQSECSDEILNVGSGVETSLSELAELLLRVTGSDLRPEYGPERKANPVPRRLANTDRALALLGFKAQVQLELGLRRLWAWWSAEAKLAERAEHA
jgi:UDP-glucose 4-epimerase